MALSVLVCIVRLSLFHLFLSLIVRNENCAPTVQDRSSDRYFNEAWRAAVGTRAPCTTHSTKLGTNLEFTNRVQAKTNLEENNGHSLFQRIED